MRGGSTIMGDKIRYPHSGRGTMPASALAGCYYFSTSELNLYVGAAKGVRLHLAVAIEQVRK